MNNLLHIPIQERQVLSSAGGTEVKDMDEREETKKYGKEKWSKEISLSIHLFVLLKEQIYSFALKKQQKVELSLCLSS